MTQITRRTALILTAVAPLAAAGATATRAATTHQVTIEGFAFSPANLSIAVGDSITFTNQDGAPHTATFESGDDTGRLNRGESATLTFATAGSRPYVCRFHRSMRGTVTVG